MSKHLICSVLWFKILARALNIIALHMTISMSFQGRTHLSELYTLIPRSFTEQMNIPDKKKRNLISYYKLQGIAVFFVATKADT